jgi:hypothetical protein
MRLRNVHVSRVLLALVWLIPTTTRAHPGTGIVVDRLGNVYFVDMVSGVWKAEPSGALTHIPGPGFHWLALDEGNALAATQLPHGSAGDIVRLGTKPTLVLSSDVPIAIGAGGALYYPVRRPSLQLVRMQSSGETTILATPGARPGSGPLREINDIALGPNGSLYFTENDAVRRIDVGGRVATVADHVSTARCASVKGIERESLPLLRGLSVDANGTIFVAATGCGSVLKVTSAGAVSTVFQGDGEWSPTGIALSGTDVYVVEFLGAGSDDRPSMVPRVRRIAANGTSAVIATARR